MKCGNFMMTKNCSNPEKLMEILDWLFGFEGTLAVNAGRLCRRADAHWRCPFLRLSRHTCTGFLGWSRPFPFPYAVKDEGLIELGHLVKADMAYFGEMLRHHEHLMPHIQDCLMDGQSFVRYSQWNCRVQCYG